MANAGKPNILAIWGDDIGITNLSCYSDGLMGYRTPNIDRIANEGMRFTDSYGEQSCTAERGHHVEHLLRLAPGQRLHRSRLAVHHDTVPADLCRVPAPTEGGQLHHRPGHRQDGRGSHLGSVALWPMT